MQLGEIKIDGYLPYISDICGGDDVDIKICMECGQTQGTFPKVTEAEEGYARRIKFKLGVDIKVLRVYI